MGAESLTTLHDGMARHMHMARAQRPVRRSQSLVVRFGSFCCRFVLVDHQYACVWVYAHATRDCGPGRAKCLFGFICQSGRMARPSNKSRFAILTLCNTVVKLRLGERVDHFRMAACHTFYRLSLAQHRLRTRR